MRNYSWNGCNRKSKPLISLCANTSCMYVFSGGVFEELQQQWFLPLRNIISVVIMVVDVSFNRFRNIRANLGPDFLLVTSSISHSECKLLPTSCAYKNISSLTDVHHDYIVYRHLFMRWVH